VELFIGLWTTYRKINTGIYAPENIEFIDRRVALLNMWRYLVNIFK